MSNNLPLFFKSKIYNRCTLPSLTYGSETWYLSTKQERKLKSAQKRIACNLMGSRDASINDKRTKIENVIMTINKKWRWPYYVQN